MRMNVYKFTGVAKLSLFIIGFFLICSCNRLPDDFIVSENMLRSKLVKMSLPEQRSFFSTLDPEMKSRLYLYKFKKDLKEQQLTKPERKLLKEIIEYYLPDAYYSDNASDDIDNMFVMKMDALGWSEEKIFKFTMTFMTVNEFNAVYGADE